MQYKKWNSDARYYDPRVIGAPGRVPDGRVVRHLVSGDIGQAIHSNQERSLIRFGKWQDWYANEDLEVAYHPQDE